MTNIFPVLSESQIRAHCGAQSFERGRGYFRNGAVFRTRRQGATIQALCAGTAAAPYRVRASLAESGIATARCTCPIGHTGTCKHVAALLFNWLQRPDDFVPCDELTQRLEQRSKDELVALVAHLVQRYPDLEEFLALPLPGADPHRTVDPEVFRRQAAAVFAEHGDDWAATSAIADGLKAIVALADGFRADGNLGAAAEIYGAVAGEIIARYRRARYGEGALIEVVESCLAGLEAGLQAGDTTGRAAGLEALYALFAANLAHAPGLDLGFERIARVLIQHTTAAEKRTLAARVRAEAEATPAHRALLFDLEKAELDDDAYLDSCRERGYQRELIERLLDLGRIDEAVREVAGMAHHSLLLLAGSFLTRGHGDAFEEVIRERLAQRLDPDLLQWLKDRLVARGDRVAALAYAERAFDLGPSLERYREVRDLARALDVWPDRREVLLERLEGAQYRRLLARILIEEGETEPALRVASRLGDDDERLLLEIARQAETHHPEEALKIYARRVELHLAEGGLNSYQAAYLLLQRMRDVFECRGRDQEWRAYAEDLRRRTPSLWALPADLDVANL